MTRHLHSFYHPFFCLSLLIVLMITVACGGGNGASSTGSTQSAASAALPTPTRPVGNFTAVGEQSILTDTARLTQTQASTVSTSTVNLELGATVYTKNQCGDCHGAQGEGVADKGKAIAGSTLSLAEFDRVLRTGGGLGNSHIFGRSAVSPTGMEALYGYVQSLQ